MTSKRYRMGQSSNRILSLPAEVLKQPSAIMLELPLPRSFVWLVSATSQQSADPYIPRKVCSSERSHARVCDSLSHLLCSHRDDKQRRLGQLDRFRPGQITSKLANAVFWIEETPLADANDAEMEDGEVADEAVSDEVLEMRVKMERKAWPWLLGMSRWGYPPGWLAGSGKCFKG